MAAMPRPRPPHLSREISRHGKAVWYVRVNKGPRTRLTAEYGTPEFLRQYQEALLGKTATVGPRKAGNGTLAWAVGLYRQSSAWLNLSVATRRQRENILRHAIESAGSERIADITRSHIVSGRERRTSTPAAARHFVETMRGLFIWAVEAELVDADPTHGVKVPRRKSDGFSAWTDADVEQFHNRWPLGTRERLACDILLYTGLRRGDAVVFGRQHVKDGIARLTTEKTGERVTIPIEPELAVTLAAGPCGELSFICGERGAPLTKESFGNWFRAACEEACVKKSAHGLRKAAATRDANRGYSESELEAKYGWRGGRMASHYTRTMNRERLSIQAAERSRKTKS